MVRRGGFLLLCLLLLEGCAIPLPVQIAGWALDGLSVLATKKTLFDHGVSVVAQKDCALWRTWNGEAVCVKEVEDGVAVAAVEAEALPALTAPSPAPVLTMPVQLDARGADVDPEISPATAVATPKTPARPAPEPEIVVAAEAPAPSTKPRTAAPVKVTSLTPVPSQQNPESTPHKPLPVEESVVELVRVIEAPASETVSAPPPMEAPVAVLDTDPESFVWTRFDPNALTKSPVPEETMVALATPEPVALSTPPAPPAAVTPPQEAVTPEKAAPITVQAELAAPVVQAAEGETAPETAPPALSVAAAEASSEPTPPAKVEKSEPTIAVSRMDQPETKAAARDGDLFFVIGTFKKRAGAETHALRHAMLAPTLMYSTSRRSPLSLVAVGPFAPDRRRDIRRRIQQAGIGSPWTLRMNRTIWRVVPPDKLEMAGITPGIVRKRR